MALQLAVHAAHEGAPTTVVVSGEIDMASAPELADCLATLTGPVVLELSAVTFFDSSGLSVCVSTQNRLAEHGAGLQVRKPQPHVRRIFEMSGLTSLLEEESSG